MNLVTVLSNQITFKDFIDISIVALMIYQVLKIVQGTRAVQILTGMVFLSILFAIGVSYNLYTLNWILDRFFDYFFIIFIILFQDQIRAALANVGTGRKMFQFFDRSPIDFDIEEIIRVCSVLSKERTGALVVLEKKNGLENYIDTGTRLDCKIHSDLIYSIFQSKSPLHDGAIIIRDNKIAAAGCFLPLSKNVDIDRHYGTRHRAALGITELSDAIVITVSEESGRISTCSEGFFTQCSSENELRKKLTQLLGNSITKERVQVVGKI